MSIRDFSFLTDENIPPELVAFLRQLELDVLDVKEQQWMGKSDVDLLRIAHAGKRVIVTHDSDFGKIVFTQSLLFVGIVYLRP